ncbi:MAG: HAD family hydrolase, partial [Bryobacteraceae bacterium]
VGMSNTIVAGLSLERHFFRVYGGNSFEKKKPAPAGIEALLAEAGVSPERALMIGDSAVDVQTARNAGIRSCGVTYGFQPETLNIDAPDYLIDRFEQLRQIVDGDHGAV